MERAIREKRAAENELEKMTQRLPQETQRMNDIIEELSNKLRLTEKERIQSSEAAARWERGWDGEQDDIFNAVISFSFLIINIACNKNLVVIKTS